MLELGYSFDDDELIGLTDVEREQGTYIIGTTGTGKSTLLRNMIFQDIHPDKKHGLCLLDPHGDLVDDILQMVPNQRADDVILFNPMDVDFPFGLNLLDCDRDNPTEVRWVISTVVSTLRRLFHYSWGPRLQHVLTNALETIVSPNFKGSTFIELYLLLNNKNYRQSIGSKIDDFILREFWATFPEGSRQQEIDFTAPILNKIGPFITDRMMRNIIGQSETSFDMEEIMDEGIILLVNLSKGDLGEENSSLMGAVLVNMVLMAALRRRKDKYEDRKPFHLYVDEFQNFATESFATLQSEARKYRVDVVVAHQFRDQLDDQNKGSTLNVGNLVIFRTTGRDGFELSSQFDNTPPPAETRHEPVYQDYDYLGNKLYVSAESPTGDGTMYQEVPLPKRAYSDVQAEMANKLSFLPNYQAWCRLIHDPRSRDDPLEKDDPPGLAQHHIKTKVEKVLRSDIKKEEMVRRIKNNSRKKFGRSRRKVIQEIEARTRSFANIVEANEMEGPEPRKKS